MGYKVRVSYKPYNYKRDYGTGRDGSGKPFLSKSAAEKRADEIRAKTAKDNTVSVIKV